jgi:hypothetical protein
MYTIFKILCLDTTQNEVKRSHENHDYVYPSGKPIMLHLLRCQGFAVAYYSFTLGRLGSTAFSPFATIGIRMKTCHPGRKTAEKSSGHRDHRGV